MAGFKLEGGSSTQAHVFGFDYNTNAPVNLALNYPGGNVGVGTSTPFAKLQVEGGSADRYGLWVRSAYSHAPSWRTTLGTARPSTAPRTRGGAWTAGRTASPGYDHREHWWHLDTCQYRTILIADLPGSLLHMEVGSRSGSPVVQSGNERLKNQP